ncbi:YraN family protein [uncultured Roseobacter sp.]|uniref:YraN family protein n=1 Tax=uncultured Roseobacter sp. TaxID=114847 RepID=UPI0026264580|nr:YraN family protein [uncultured Roseobacter sp.]
MAARNARVAMGQMAFHAGSAAEEIAAAAYEHRGFAILEKRWRGEGGEIDLIARKDGVVVFIEVKKSKSFAAAASHIVASQIKRITVSAEQYLSTQPAGLLTEARFDAALVDSVGSVQIIPNAFDAS